MYICTQGTAFNAQATKQASNKQARRKSKKQTARCQPKQGEDKRQGTKDKSGIVAQHQIANFQVAPFQDRPDRRTIHLVSHILLIPRQSIACRWPPLALLLSLHLHPPPHHHPPSCCAHTCTYHASITRSSTILPAHPRNDRLHAEDDKPKLVGIIHSSVTGTAWARQPAPIPLCCVLKC